MQSQNGDEIHVLALAGSVRSGSFDQALIRAARELAPEHVRADALLIATPEYNGSVPAVLKNAIDWASRRRPDSPLRNKPAAVMGASQSPGGTRRAQAHLRDVLHRTGADGVDGPSLYLARAFERVSDGRLTSEVAREAVREIVTGLVDAVAIDTAKTIGDAA